MIKKKKIAILGTSPIMILLYFRLREKNFIDVYENSNIGGAWHFGEINGLKYTTHNNVIVAMNKKEENFIDMINKELENLGCTKTKPSGEYKTLSNYKHKNLFIHNLSGLYTRFKKCKSLIKKKVTNIKTISNRVFLNGIEYDQVYLPSCFDIKKILIHYKKQKEKLNPNLILDSVLSKIGDDGTLLLPTFNWDFCNGKEFNYFKTPSKSGSLTKVALSRNDFIRTKNPIYSFAVSGKSQ